MAPGYPCTLRNIMYVVNVETPRTVQVRHIHLRTCNILTLSSPGRN